MRISEAIVVLLFVAGFVGVYVSAVVIVVGAIRRRLRRKAAKASRARRIARAVVPALAVIGVACMAWGHFVEPYRLETTRVTLVSDKLPAGCRPIRIVQIGDLHCEPRQRLEGKLPGVIAALRPDAIVFTGDAINSVRGLDNFKTCMSRLAWIAPTFAVEGNWDLPRSPGIDLYGGTGVRLLDGEAEEVQVGPVKVRFVGGPPGGWRAVDKLLSGPKDGAFTVVLDHYPDAVQGAAMRGADLCLAGHTHGGQVALPFYGAMITLSKSGKTYEAGLYRVGRTWMYVNRGIGMEGSGMPRVRFCARPEVTLIEISPETAGGASAPTSR